ncbi:MAG: N-formylglutamate amidohydrolase [Alphaproteobacteria bacterium]|nr:N-formylglutamate amidohydrolase [Alphaproteobacteria bacterium]
MTEQTPQLLGGDDPEPVRVLRPEGTSDFLLTADHAGRLIPQSLGDLGVSASELQRHIAWDIGIAATTELLSQHLDAPAVLQVYSRLVIDCNRDPSWPSAVPVISEHTPISGNQRLSASQRDARRREIFAPYHNRIDALLRDRMERPTVLVAMHSFTPVYKGVARAVEVGVLYNPNDRDTRLPHIMLELLRAEGDVAVGDNEPYSITDASDYTVPVHGEAKGVPHVEIEIRQDLIAEPAGQAAWAARLARLLPRADAALSR